jgi:hypothetical protein
MHGRQSPVPLVIGLAGLALAGAGIAQVLDATTRVTSSTGRSLSSR